MLLFFIIYLNMINSYMFQTFELPDCIAVFFSQSLFLEFLNISDSYHGLSSSGTTIVLLGMQNLANSMKVFVNNELVSFTLP